jgi:hypothetical protein
MSQGLLPFQFKIEDSGKKLTAMAGLLVYLDLMLALKVRESVRSHVKAVGDQGWMDEQILFALVLLNIAGGDVVEDIEQLEGDGGLTALILKMETQGMSRQQRREFERRFRKGRERALPSISAIRRYLEKFHDEEQEALRPEKGAFIPAANAHLVGLEQVIADVVAKVQSWVPQKTATLDMDATLDEVHKRTALFCYKHFRAYQPLNTWWAEHEMVLHSEFRDGNVPAGYEQLRVFKRSLELLPEGVEKVYLRSDTAGYQWDLLKYCAEEKSERFGVIEFAVGCDVTPEFKAAVAAVHEKEWQPLISEKDGIKVDTGQEWTEVCYVPNEIGKSKNGPEYRFIATREPLAQKELPGMEKKQEELPFPTMDFGESKERYKVFGLVSNRHDLAGDELIRWLRERCGKSEEAHAVMKNDLAGGRLPSWNFGANAAWWGIMILSLNVNTAMKRLALGGKYVKSRMKAIRYGFINMAGRLVRSGRQLVIKLSGSHTCMALLLKARERIFALAHAPYG